MNQLVDRGANGFICGNKVCIMHTNGHHHILYVIIATAGAVVLIQGAESIMSVYQYVHIENIKNIHSCGKLTIFQNEVNGKSIKILIGLQYITTKDGYYIPLNLIYRLLYMPLKPYTYQEFKDIPKIILTIDTKWEPSILDNTISNTKNWYEIILDHHKLPSLLFDFQVNYMHMCTV